MSFRSRQAGFSIVEVIFALMILSFGILAMGASTGYVMRQVQASDLRSERVAAIRAASERIRGTDWDALDAAFCATAPATTDHYTVTCSVSTRNRIKRVRLITTGPGFRDGRFVTEMTETFALSLAQPVQR